MTFANRLVAAREAMELSQNGLGEEINAAQSTVATWERGKNEPDLATIKRLAKALNRAPEWLAFGLNSELSADLATVLELNIRAISGPGGLEEASTDNEEVILARYYFGDIILDKPTTEA